MMISDFLLQYSSKLESASLTADRLTITVKKSTPLHEVIILFVDLINLCHPTEAVMVDPLRIRLEFE